MNKETSIFPKRLTVRDAALIGDWDEVTATPLSSITKKEGDTELLDGIVIKGYETKFNVTNANGERYTKDCLDKFVKEYFIDHKLNMVVDVQHGWGVDDQIGRVVYLEINTVGFYFVAYIPRTVARYEQVKNLLKEGILQGFSKCGYALEWNYHYKENGDFDYVEFTDFALCSVSLVTMPANAVPFEAVGEKVSNRLTYKNMAMQAKKKKSIYKHYN